ncbi:hypothetical protein DDW44_30805 [Streptomyces tirandamycinicus]|uniref:Uncharacterized protein n=1 Tax=Streptomyces tirandamycinicus TaxID=2174846 RepID=A0A2S1T3L1_9ACTN|nr:hypothetical protein DDW44_30805 [Streptomyces tirandamycinicus]
MSPILWTAWVAFFVVYETIALLNRKDGDTLSENTRGLFRIRRSKAGRAIFTVAVAGGAVWFLLHILTESM